MLGKPFINQIQVTIVISVVLLHQCEQKCLESRHQHLP